MKYLFPSLLLLLCLRLAAFPVNSYDYQTPLLQVSPMAAAMGGLNLSLQGDPGLLYGNPALLAYNTSSVMSVGLKLQDRDDISISDMLNAASALKKNQLVSLHFASDKGGMAVRPLVSIDANTTWTEDDDTFRASEDYNLTCYQLAVAETEGKFTYGLGLKYLDGRLVYLRERETTEGWVREQFINDRLHGLSFDLGMAMKFGSFVWGVNAWALYSKLWWLDNPDRVVTKRVGSTLGWQSGNTALIVGSQRKWSSTDDQTYHGGIQQALSLGDSTSVIVRAGAYSHNFDNADVTWTSFGLSYYYKTFRIDTSMATHDMAIKNTRYLVSISMGM